MESKHCQLFRGTRTKLACTCWLRKNIGDTGTQQWVSLVLHISAKNPDWDTWVHPSWCLNILQTTRTDSGCSWVCRYQRVSKVILFWNKLIFPSSKVWCSALLPHCIISYKGSLGSGDMQPPLFCHVTTHHTLVTALPSSSSLPPQHRTVCTLLQSLAAPESCQNKVSWWSYLFLKNYPLLI